MRFCFFTVVEVPGVGIFNLLISGYFLLFTLNCLSNNLIIGESNSYILKQTNLPFLILMGRLIHQQNPFSFHD